jgi:tRNA-2-methylthio-N6-dimethylallyladenosine synthase
MGWLNARNQSVSIAWLASVFARLQPLVKSKTKHSLVFLRSPMNKDWNLPNLKMAQKRTIDDTLIERSLFEIPEQYINIGQDKTYYLRTYGCQANERDSETIKGILEKMSFKQCEDMNEADVIIFNTCAIRENAENKVFGEIGNVKVIKQTRPDVVLMVGGCMTQEENVVNRLLKTYHQVDVIFGTHNIHRLPQLLIQAYFNKERVVEVFSKEGEVYENLPVSRNNKSKAWVNIIYGCDKFCTYCIVPYTRGKERSRLKEDILLEVDDLVKQGFKEVTLLGQNVNAYGKDLNLDFDFADLLESVALKDIPRVRFMTSHPWDFTDKLIEVIAKMPNVMPFIHLPLQSGNNEILKIMGRRYTKEDYMVIFNKLKEKVPEIALSTDIIVGFPNETEIQFQETLDMIDVCQFDNVYSFIYSAREKTPAASMIDNVTQSEKSDRLQRLNKRIGIHALMHNQNMVGKTVRVLVDGPSKKNSDIYSGYTETNKLVNFKPMTNCIGEIILVEIISAKTWTLQGKQV